MMEGPSVVITPVSVAATKLSPPRHPGGRARSNSLIKVEEVGKRTQEEVLDQNVYANINAEWVNRKGEPLRRKTCGRWSDRHSGAWVMHPLLIITGKAMIDSIPGMTQELSWTLVNLAYLAVGFHHFCFQCRMTNNDFRSFRT